MDLIKNVKVFFIKRKFRKSINIERQGVLVSPSKMRNIGLLFCNNDNSEYNAFTPIYDLLKDKGIAYEVLVSNYIPGFAPSHPKLREHVILMKDFHKEAVNNNKLLVDFIDHEFDLLIDLSNGGFENEYVVGLSKAKLKIGFSEENEGYYDIYMVPRDGDMPIDSVNAMFDYLDKFTK